MTDDEKTVKQALNNQEFVVVKTVSTAGTPAEKAVFIEHNSDKAFPYMLVAKVNESKQDDIGNMLSQAAGQNKTFKIQIIDSGTPVTTVT